MGVLRWWRGLSQVARFDLYTRWSVYVLLAVGPITIVSAFTHPQPIRPALAVIAGASIVQAIVGVAVVRATLDRRPTGRPAPRLLYVALSVVTVAGLAVTWSQLPHDRPNARLATVFFVVAFVGLLSLAVRFRYAMLALLAAIAGPATIEAIGLGATQPTPPRSVLASAAVTFIAGACAVAGYRAGLWMLDVVWELDRARGVEARLAVAEERLRFARDLHDVVGRGLAVVSLKSDLAARLAQRGQPEAADEMLEVRRVAQELLADVRDVVRGYRTTDLGAELAGARSVLASAGIACRIIGTSDAIGEQAQATLGWVVREGTTNVLRHSQATACTITVQMIDDFINLTMENDGANGDGAPVLGHGLIGLTERLAAAGGVLSAERLPGARFRLAARLPVSGAAAGPAGREAGVSDVGRGSGVGDVGRGSGVGDAGRAAGTGHAGRPVDDDRAEATVP